MKLIGVFLIYPDLETVVDPLIEERSCVVWRKNLINLIEQLKAYKKKLNGNNKMLNDKVDQLLPLKEQIESFKRQIERLEADNEI